MSSPEEAGSQANLRVQEGEGGSLALTLDGRLDTQTTGQIWREAVEAVERASPKQLTIHASGITYCDGAGIGLLVELRRRQRESGGAMDIQGFSIEFQPLQSNLE